MGMVISLKYDSQIHLNHIQLAFPEAYEAKKNLNADFLENGRIAGAVSFLYYPVQNGPMSHAELEIEGVCYNLRSCVGPCTIPQVQSYHRRIYKIRRGNEYGFVELAFVRFGIPVTPKQLNHIQKDIENLKSMTGLTCMHGVKRALKKYTGYSMPFPICLYPTTTAAALYISKNMMRSKKISQIDPQISHRSRGLIIVDTSIAVLTEMMAIAASVGCLYINALILFRACIN